MSAENPDRDDKAPSTNKPESKTGPAEASPILLGPHGPTIRVAVEGKPDLQIWIQGVPDPLLNTINNLTRPPSHMKKFLSFCKDLAPPVTSVAAAFLSIVAFIYTSHQKNVADALAREEKAKAADTAQKQALSDLIEKFGNTVVPKASDINEESKLEVAAMKFAAYGEQALPAIRMALGASDDGLRHGAVLVAEQMYRAEIVERGRLTKQILGYYSGSSSVLRRGVMEWLVQMNRELSKAEVGSAVGMLKASFGEKGEDCAKQDPGVTIQAINFLRIWPSKDSWQLMRGMADSCTSDRVRVLASEEEGKMKKNMQIQE